MAASNKTQLVFSHVNNITVVSNGYDVSSSAFSEVHSYECRLFFYITSQKYHCVLLTAFVNS